MLKENCSEEKIPNYSINTNVGNITFTVNMTKEEMIERHQKIEENKLNPNSCKREPNDDEIKLQVKDFDNKYNWGYIGNSKAGIRFWKSFVDASATGFHHFIVAKDDFDYVVKKHNEWIERERELSKTVELNFKGKDLEKEGKIDEAISSYEENVKLGYPAMHSYHRLVVLYHKMKDYENEKRICLLIQDIFEKENEKRLQQALSNEENKDLTDLIIEAHKENKQLFVEGRHFVVYNPYEVKKYKLRYNKLVNKYGNNQNKSIGILR
ncbi:MAG: hypothetical protein LBS01_04415 [Prevotellaceae bacterium]|nr:hypothetical protein [Prevotellaceae bacterium]